MMPATFLKLRPSPDKVREIAVKFGCKFAPEASPEEAERIYEAKRRKQKSASQKRYRQKMNK